jgi:hypothetical protein
MKERYYKWTFLAGGLVGLTAAIVATYVILMVAFSGRPIQTLIAAFVLGLLSVLTSTQVLGMLTRHGNFLAGTLAGLIGGPMLLAGYLLLTWLLAFLNPRI